MADEASQYGHMHQEFAGHPVVRHGICEHVRGDIYANAIEGHLIIFRRGMNGVYQHCSEKYLKRYLAEFDFRYNELELTLWTAVAGLTRPCSVEDI